MKMRIVIFFVSQLLALNALSYAEKGDSSEVKLFCKNAEKVVLQQFGLQIIFENCMKQNIKVEAGQFFHPMTGIVVVKPDANQLVQAFSCSMVYGGLAEDNDVTEAMTCID